MNLTTPLPDTTEILLLNAINALRIAEQDKIADNLDERLDAITNTPKVAIYVSGGIVQEVLSNIGQDLEVELVDKDNDPETAKDRWVELYNELEFENL